MILEWRLFRNTRQSLKCTRCASNTDDRDGRRHVLLNFFVTDDAASSVSTKNMRPGCSRRFSSTCSVAPQARQILKHDHQIVLGDVITRGRRHCDRAPAQLCTVGEADRAGSTVSGYCGYFVERRFFPPCSASSVISHQGRFGDHGFRSCVLEVPPEQVLENVGCSLAACFWWTRRKAASSVTKKLSSTWRPPILSSVVGRASVHFNDLRVFRKSRHSRIIKPLLQRLTGVRLQLLRTCASTSVRWR